MMREEFHSGMVVLNLMVHRYRKVYVAFPLYLLFLVVMFHLPKHWIPDPVLGILMVPFGLGLLWTVFGFVNADADIASSDTAYSSWILRLPLKTRSLALWPMLAATTWAIGSWLLLSYLCLQNRVHGVAVVWPALAFAALALIFQAILWPPVKVGSLRMVLAMALPTAVALFGTVATYNGWKAERICLVYGVICVLSAAIGYGGLVKARTTPSLGKKKRESVEAQSNIGPIRHSKKPFRSPEAAQFWLEWRMQGRLLPLITILILTLASVGLFMERNSTVETGMIVHNKLTGPDIAFGFDENLFLRTYLQFLPWIPLVLATIIGLGARPASLRGADGGYHLYHATRPLTPFQMYWAKMKSIGAGTLLATGATMLVMLIWSLLPINKAYREITTRVPMPGLSIKSRQSIPQSRQQPSGMLGRTGHSVFGPQKVKNIPSPEFLLHVQRIDTRNTSYLSHLVEDLREQGLFAKSLALVMLMWVSLTLWAWRNQAVGACMDYIVSDKLAKAYPLVVVMVSASIITIWKSSEAMYQERRGLGIMCAVLALWIAAKGTLAVIGLVKLKKLRPSDSNGAALTIATWLAAGAGAAVALGVIEHWAGEYNVYLCLRHPVPELLGFVLVPVARPILARILLETGRHR